MSRSEDAWEDVGEQFKKLGGVFREHFESSRDVGVVEEGAVDETVRGFRENLQTAFAAVVDTASDPEVHDEARRAAGSFFEALGKTFEQLGAELRRSDDTDEDPDETIEDGS